MELYLLRHGIAEARATSGGDRDRALTPEGIERLRAQILKAKEAGLAPKWIVASPYLRAQQTAHIAAALLGYSEPILPSTRLTPDSEQEEVWAEVRDLAPDSPLLFVSHEPLLSTVASWMTGEDRVIEFKPASLVRIDFRELTSEPRGSLQWQIHA
ncbi:MAG: histidine phosphatase family protein [Bryobacteraceae bacterium]